MEIKPGLAIKIFGWLSAILILLAHFFRMQAWPGAGILIIISTTLFLFFYLPLFFLQAWKNKENRYVSLIQTITLFLYASTALWKTMHWPGGGVLFNSMFYYTFFFLIPFTFYLLVRTGKNSLSLFHTIIVIILVMSFSTSSLSRSISSGMLEGFAQSAYKVEGSLQRAEAKNARLYEAFELLEEKNNNPYYDLALKLRSMSDSSAEYVHDMRRLMISRINNIPLSEADSLSLSELRNKTTYEVGNELIIGDIYNPNKGKFSGHELKGVIDRYRDSVVSLVQSENKEFIRAGINLDTENSIDENGEPVSWAVYTFYNLPAMTTISTLTSIENEIRNAETQVLADLLNMASKSSKDNIAMKVADMGEKLEKEKQEKQIAILQKERELNEVKMNAKNSELESVNRTIAWFVTGLFICGVMLFFIIRSNLIRKKINRELETQKKIIEDQKYEVEHQKELIEEKQREIIDSIKYARRIQSSLLTSEKYIEKSLKRSKT
jgi:hypothetical protein